MRNSDALNAAYARAERAHTLALGVLQEHGPGEAYDKACAYAEQCEQALEALSDRTAGIHQDYDIDRPPIGNERAQ